MKHKESSEVWNELHHHADDAHDSFIHAKNERELCCGKGERFFIGFTQTSNIQRGMAF